MTKANKKPMSTFEREMQNPKRKKEFDKGYKEFVMSEIMIALMEGNETSVRKLAESAGISPTTVQSLRSGAQKDVKLTNFISIAEACGYNLVLEKDENRIAINQYPLPKTEHIYKEYNPNA